jgi:DNA-directed RNA polymerase subunit RPC12/RpoP
MPNNARDLDGNIVRCATYRREAHEGKIACPDCGWKMVYRPRVPEVRRDHFAHLPRKSGDPFRKCAWALMSSQHHSALQTLADEAPQVFDLLEGILGKEEARLEDGSRRADVLFPGGEGRYPVAFEAQFSRITYGANGTGRTIEERTRDYHANGVHVVWCFFGHLPWARDLIATCRRVYGCVGVLDEHGLSVEFRGANALWLDSHPIDALDRRNAYRQKKASEAREEQERQRREEQERREEAAQRASEQRARMEARRKEESAEWWAAFEERQREEKARYVVERERRQQEYERQVEARREAERRAIEIAEQGHRKRIADTNRRLGVDPENDDFTVEPVDVPASDILGTPRRTLYRVMFRGMPVGWVSENKAPERLLKLNTLRRAVAKKEVA